MKISCYVVTDLLPLYHDGVCNQSTKKLVAEHLDECEPCRALLNKIGNTTIDDKIKAERQEVIMHQTKALRTRYAQNIGTAIHLGLLFLGLLTCLIVDIAISGALTWSLIPVSACIFAGFVLTPITKNGAKGIMPSLIILSILVVPFLFTLSLLTDSDGLLLPIGIRMSVIALAYLWGVVAIFEVLRSRKFMASAVSLLLAIPVSILINFTLSRIITSSLFDIWDAMSFAIIVGVAAIFIFLDFYFRN